MASDRIFGLVVLALALAYIASAFQIQTSFLSDPVGPKSFPIIIGVVAAIASAIIVVKPDPDPAWPNARIFAKLALAVAALIAYSYMLKPLGFLIPTALVSGLLSYQISSKRVPAVLAGIGIALVLFVIFKYALGLNLIGLHRDWF